MNLLDDIELVRQFIQGEIKLYYNHNLRVEPLSDTIQLLSKKGILLAKVKNTDNSKVFFIRKESDYWELLNRLLIENSVIPLGKEEGGLMRYEYQPVPDGFKVNYGEVVNLWRIWRFQTHKKRSDVVIEKGLQIFINNKWQAVRSMVFNQEDVYITTSSDELVFTVNQRIIWASKKVGEPPAQSLSQDLDLGETFIAKDNTSNSSNSYSTVGGNDTRQAPQSKNNNILSVYQGKLYIQTIEGEIVVEGSNLKFWFTPPDGEEAIPMAVEVQSNRKTAWELLMS
ncbi:hypothetical protein [Calothrix sp. PCC 6303]|uniref:hypothetical protein n=1 Tax=Calothrix sp. PCC 6303 TaxID=1170562 RepID=UPI0002A003BD|nr:hypothetical protein [Calothrix sp. PCC 6303]AFZ04235.1 hypothetical protein Cal6303_5352 [Calothrix sp. PCC 6303]